MKYKQRNNGNTKVLTFNLLINDVNFWIKKKLFGKVIGQAKSG